jgi:GH35 family endo-1,4-beta-xylanase
VGRTVNRILIALVLLGIVFLLLTANPGSSSDIHTVYAPFITNTERLHFGTATSSHHIDIVEYEVVLLGNFDVIVPEFEGNYYWIAEYGWANIDKLVAYSEAHNLEFHYHTVFWIWYPAQPPDPMAWLHEAMTRYPQIIHWIVVNEGYDYYGNPLLPYIDEAFIEARAVRPDAVLWYNGILTTAAEQEQAKRLVELGLADAIGVQCHLDLQSDLSVYDDFLGWLQQRGVTWRVTELDVSLPAYTTEYLSAQAHKFSEVYAMVRRYGGHSITFWEFTDKYNWLQRWGTPFDYYFNPKPAWEVFTVSEE